MVRTPARIGYVAALDRVPPTEAVALGALAELRGFDGVMAADQFQPRLPRHGQSAFVWNVLTAIAERTRGDIGPVTTPTFRWHPAVVAQASATLAMMYPGRHWLGISSGEAVDEHVVGVRWPEAPERIQRMFEAIELIKKLFAGSIVRRDVRHHGPAFRLESSRLWTMPSEPPEILVATAGPVTARRAGRTADGLITREAPFERLEHLLKRFAEGAREAGRDPAGMPKVLQLRLAWAETDREALRSAASEWAHGALGFGTADLRSPFEIEQLVRSVRPEDFADRLLVSADPDVHRARIQRYVDLGFDRIYLQNVGPDQLGWLEVFGRDVLPKVTR